MKHLFIFDERNYGETVPTLGEMDKPSRWLNLLPAYGFKILIMKVKYIIPK